MDMKGGKKFSGAYGGKNKPMKGGSYEKSLEKQKGKNNPFAKPMKDIDKKMARKVERSKKSAMRQAKKGM